MPTRNRVFEEFHVSIPGSRSGQTQAAGWWGIILFVPTAHSLIIRVTYTLVGGTMEEDSVSGGHSQKEWRERFMTTVLQSENEKSTHFNVLTKDKYQQLINEVETAANTDKKTPLQQRCLKRFGVIDIGGVKKLVAAGERNEDIKYYLTVDELYDVIDAAHGAVGHGGRDRMLAETSKKYANITKEEIQLYLSMCQVCHMKKKKKETRSGLKTNFTFGNE
uniref:Integrase zinc-binding domain-containing protein n=1 Tax=Clastoptera arizonana TaxID=38151 RepID=A0A1B6DP93_9HEMI